MIFMLSNKFVFNTMFNTMFHTMFDNIFDNNFDNTLGWPRRYDSSPCTAAYRTVAVRNNFATR